MNQLIHWVMRIDDETDSLGTAVSSMGCAMCFSAVASQG